MGGSSGGGNSVGVGVDGFPEPPPPGFDEGKQPELGEVTSAENKKRMQQNAIVGLFMLAVGTKSKFE